MKDDRLWNAAAESPASSSREVAKRISSETRGRLAQPEWKAICGMRDVLIHDDYVGVGLDKVWSGIGQFRSVTLNGLRLTSAPRQSS